MSRNDLTRNQQQWLVHIEACASSGETLKGYAERCGLSLKTLYMAKSRLKGLGILDGEASGRDVRFVRVSRAVEVCTASDCRVQFPNRAMWPSACWKASPARFKSMDMRATTRWYENKTSSGSVVGRMREDAGSMSSRRKGLIRRSYLSSHRPKRSVR